MAWLLNEYTWSLKTGSQTIVFVRRPLVSAEDDTRIPGLTPRTVDRPTGNSLWMKCCRDYVVKRTLHFLIHLSFFFFSRWGKWVSVSSNFCFSFLDFILFFPWQLFLLLFYFSCICLFIFHLSLSGEIMRKRCPTIARPWLSVCWQRWHPHFLFLLSR